MEIPPRDEIIGDPSPRPSLFPLMGTGAIAVAGLYYGQELLIPLVLASLLAFVLAPACRLLERAWLPRVVAVMVVVLLTFGVIGGLGIVVGRQISSLADNMETYRGTVTQKWNALRDRVGFIEQYTHVIAPSAPKQDAGGEASSSTASQAAEGFGLSNISGFSVARALALPLLGPLATGGVVLVFTIFVLMASDDLRDRLVRLVGRRDLHRTILALNDAAGRLSRYFLFQLALNSGFGALIGVALWFIGLPAALLWGILAAVMRFVPFVGVFVAVVPPLVLAVAVVPGWTVALLVLVLFLVAEMIMGQVVEPLIYGHSTGLSPLAVIVATAFWALLWGPIGLLIATPLTVCLVVVGRHVEALSFLDVILGDRPPLTPAETFYQRALEGQAAALVPGARRQIAATSLTDYVDKVALAGLALAQADLARDALAFERLEEIHAQIEHFIAELDKGATPPRGGAERTVVPADSQAIGMVLCISGRGQLDDLAAALAVRGLAAAGIGAETAPNTVLGASGDAVPALAGARICCLSVLEEGGTLAGVLYFIRRIQKQAPGVTVVVGLWDAGRDSPLLAALRQEGGGEHVVLSVGELVAFCRAQAVRAPAPRAALSA